VSSTLIFIDFVFATAPTSSSLDDAGDARFSAERRLEASGPELIVLSRLPVNKTRRQ
jgi:hypothetical protein